MADFQQKNSYQLYLGQVKSSSCRVVRPSLLRCERVFLLFALHLLHASIRLPIKLIAKARTYRDNGSVPLIDCCEVARRFLVCVDVEMGIFFGANHVAKVAIENPGKVVDANGRKMNLHKLERKAQMVVLTKWSLAKFPRPEKALTEQVPRYLYTDFETNSAWSYLQQKVDCRCYNVIEL